MQLHLLSYDVAAPACSAPWALALQATCAIVAMHTRQPLQLLPS